MPQPSKAQIQARMAQKYGKRTSQTGGKGSMRRKHKAAPKQSNQDDKRLSTQLKRLNVNTIPAIDEVNLFRDDGTVIHFTKPKVQAEIASNTYVVSGNHQMKKLEELMPDILPQLGQESFNKLKDLAKNFSALNPNIGDEDEDVPTLIDENFEEVSRRDEKTNNESNETKDENKQSESVEATNETVTKTENVPENVTENVTEVTENVTTTETETETETTTSNTETSTNENSNKNETEINENKESETTQSTEDVPDLVPKTETNETETTNTENPTEEKSNTTTLQPDTEQVVNV